MNRKKLGLAMASLLGILLFALTCGSALAEEYKNYVRVENRTKQRIIYSRGWSKSNRGVKPNNQIFTIDPGKDSLISGPPGYDYLTISISSEDGTKYFTVEGDTGSDGLGANHAFYFDKQGYLRLKKLD